MNEIWTNRDDREPKVMNTRVEGGRKKSKGMVLLDKPVERDRT